MRNWLAGLVCVTLLGTAQAQSTVQLLTPSPLTIVLTAGQWLFQNQRKVYYIEVESRAASFEQARSEAFRLAVEQAVGTLVSSESVSQGQRLTRDEIITYASGYVDRYEIAYREDQPRGVLLRLNVWVAHSKLSTRLLNRSDASGQIDGAQAAAQAETIITERYSGDRLLRSVLADYPRRAYKFDVKPTEVYLDRNRALKMRIPFHLRLAPEYLESLWTALEATAQSQGPTPNVSMVKVTTGKLFNVGGGTVGFNDPGKTQLIAYTATSTQPAVLLTISSSDSPTIQTCYRWSELDQIVNSHYPQWFFISAGPTYANIDGRLVLNAYIERYVHSSQLEHITSIDLAVIPGKECPN